MTNNNSSAAAINKNVLPFPQPRSLAAEFTMSPADPATDVPPMTDIYHAAFQEDPANTYWWSPDPEKMRQWLTYRVLTKFRDPGVRHHKIVHCESGDIVAWARWDIPKGAKGFGVGGGGGGVVQQQVDVSDKIDGAGDAAGGRGEGAKDGNTALTASEAPTANDVVGEPEDQAEAPIMETPEGADPELALGFFAKLKGMSAKWEADKKLVLSLIATSPKYQRRGAARALIEPLLAVADDQGLDAYLEATPTGKPVYERLGFREVDNIDFDMKTLTKGKVDMPYQLCIMIRKPAGSR